MWKTEGGREIGREGGREGGREERIGFIQILNLIAYQPLWLFNAKVILVEEQ